MEDVGGEVATQALLEVRRRCLVGSGRPSMLMLVSVGPERRSPRYQSGPRGDETPTLR